MCFLIVSVGAHKIQQLRGGGQLDSGFIRALFKMCYSDLYF